MNASDWAHLFPITYRACEWMDRQTIRVHAATFKEDFGDYAKDSYVEWLFINTAQQRIWSAGGRDVYYAVTARTLNRRKRPA